MSTDFGKIPTQQISCLDSSLTTARPSAPALDGSSGGLRQEAPLSKESNYLSRIRPRTTPTFTDGENTVERQLASSFELSP